MEKSELDRIFNCASSFDSRNYSQNLPDTMKDGVQIVNYDEYKSIGTHWIALYLYTNNATYFDSFEIELIQKEIKKFIGIKNITTNINRIKAYNSIMC